MFLPYLKHHDQVTAISFSTDGQFVATGCIDGNVRLWSVGSGQLHGPLMPHPGVIQFVEFHPDGRHLLTTSRPAAGADGTEARIWDLAANKPRSLLLEGTDARHAQFIPNSTHALVADQEHRLRVHETKTGSLTIEPVKTSGDIHHFEFNDQGTKLITATAAGIARVWDQGNRTLNCCKTSVDVIEDALVPACAEPFAANVLFDRRVALENCQCHPPKCTGDFRS